MGVNPLHIFYLVMLLGMGGYVWHCQMVKERESVRADQAEKALVRVKAETERLQKAKEDADEAIKAYKRRNDDRVKRLRGRPNSGRVPPAPAASKRPDLAAFDRTLYSRAYGELVKGLRGLADEGTAAVIDLNGAKEWSTNVLRLRLSEQLTLPSLTHLETEEAG